MNPRFMCGCAQSADVITFASYDFTDINYDEYSGPSWVTQLSSGRWRRRKIDGWLEDLALDHDGNVMGLTTERQFIRPAFDGPIEQISEPQPPLAAGLQSLRAIGDGIYACGGNGLVFRRSQSGWHGIAHELLTPHPTTPDNHLTRIDGPSEDQIYILDYYGVFFWNGISAKRIVDLPKLLLVAIHVERPDLIWLCGWEGALLRGNFRDGFTQILNQGRQAFLSVCEFGGKVYIAGENKLWVYDGVSIVRVDLGIERHLPIRNLTRTRDALWAVGDDIFRLKAEGRWERIPYDPPWLETSGEQ